MTSICIAGANQPDLERVCEILQHAGMQLAQPAKRAEPVGIAFWHERVMAVAAEESDNVERLSNVGRLWEKLAGDIFVANAKLKLWGWADSRSTWLLDFWLNFEPQLNFILVCVSPQQMLASAMTAETVEVSVEAVMNAWQVHHQELLRFHHRNPQRSLLVDVRECAGYPRLFIERCAAQWKRRLTATDEAVAHQEQDALALYLAQQLSKNYPQVAGLQHEIAATITRLGTAEQVADTTVLGPEQVVADFRALRDRSAALQQVQAASAELAAQQEQIDALSQAHADLQREKETLTTANSALAARRDALEQEIENVARACEEQVKSIAESRFEINQLTTKLEHAVASHAQQLQDAQKEREEIKQENELLLLQLHQVQEELEHHFLQLQDVQKTLKTAEERWQRMLQRNPDYYDYASIEVLSAEGDDGTTATWLVKDLNAAGRSLAELEFKTIVEHGVAGLVFARQSGSTGPLTRWPINSASQHEFVLIPVATSVNARERGEILFNFATQDWDLLQSLTRLLGSALVKPGVLKASAHFQPEALRNGVSKLLQILEKFQAVVRYDRVSLKREQVNPDYEYLWLGFENVAFGGKRWPKFEFRLSCANIGTNRFGIHPKLEFPEESGSAPFEGWFNESYDDFGAKLELRFALPQSMDLEVWGRLSLNDRAFLADLIKRLPAILGTLKNAGVQIKRPWDDWVKMAREIQSVVTLRTTAPPLLTPVSPVQAAALKSSASPSASPKPPLAAPILVKTAEKPLAKRVSKQEAAEPVGAAVTRTDRKPKQPLASPPTGKNAARRVAKSVSKTKAAKPTLTPKTRKAR